jgi:hypothetical protein
MGPGAHNMKHGTWYLDTAQNGFGSAKYEKGPGALGTAENEFESAKHKNENRRP